MKNTKKAFTLVELIVVITILAVLATVAFISLTGHAQDAKNSKVTADLRTLASALETSMTQGKATVKNAISGDLTAVNTVDNGTQTASSIVIDDTASTGNYSVGNVNFGQIGQNGADFVDSNNNQYIYAFFATGAIAQYQVAGQITEASGDNKIVVKGNYYDAGATNDVDGLISASGATNGNADGANLGTASIY